MAPGRCCAFVLIGVALPLLFFYRAEAGEMGVSYGRVADNLPDPGKVTQLLKTNGITMVRIYDANSSVLNSLANTGIKVMVMVPNENVAQAASDPSYARQWVQNNVAAYPSTQINGVAVGNEVFNSAPSLTQQLVPAMTNVQAALEQLGLDRTVKVSTPIAFNALQNTFPPSSGRFRDDIAQSVMKPMLDLLQRTGSKLGVNMYPFFTYADQPEKIPLDYALGNSNPGVRDEKTGLVYPSLLDAQLDATYYAMEDLGYSGVSLYNPENGWASGGKRKPGNGGRRRLLAAGDDAASVANAQAYNNNLINRVLSGRTGTPHRPSADLDVYIFSLFNENGKGSGSDDVEQHFGLFDPRNMQPVYPFSFRSGGGPPGPPTPSWCVANANVGNARLQAALDYACANGADCSAIQNGGSCFQPDTVLAHATYAVNSYYQNKQHAAGSCDFNGAASIVYQAPDMCNPKPSWCVAKAGVGDAQLKTALDYACSNGADCSAIQPGGKCYQPNTMVAHASYAFNSYYQRKNRASGSCDFSGAGNVVYQQPTIGNCVLSSNR